MIVQGDQSPAGLSRLRRTVSRRIKTVSCLCLVTSLLCQRILTTGLHLQGPTDVVGNISRGIDAQSSRPSRRQLAMTSMIEEDSELEVGNLATQLQQYQVGMKN